MDCQGRAFQTPPLVGWILKLSADIPLRRGSRESVEKMMEECRQTIRGGMPVMIFPEGTRSPVDGKMLPFKDGAFQLAIETQAPDPVAGHQRHAQLPAEGFQLVRRRRRAREGPGVATDGGAHSGGPPVAQGVCAFPDSGRRAATPRRAGQQSLVACPTLPRWRPKPDRSAAGVLTPADARPSHLSALTAVAQVGLFSAPQTRGAQLRSLALARIGAEPLSSAAPIRVRREQSAGSADR